jgi:hypothetical protein
LWHVEHVCGVTVVWSKRAGIQALVVWQLSQALLLGRCLTGLPVASLPLWQLKQVPITWV